MYDQMIRHESFYDFQPNRRSLMSQISKPAQSSPTPGKIDLGVSEGFPRQRLTVIPTQVVRRCQALPITRQLHITHLGQFPQAPRHYVDRPQGTPQTILIYCLEGQGQTRIGSAEYTINREQALIIPPETSHMYRASAQDPWSIFWIHFDGSASGEIIEAIAPKPQQPVLSVPDFRSIRQAFEDIYSCINYNYADAGLLAMTTEFLRLISKIRLNSAGYRFKHEESSDRIQVAIAFMEEHLGMAMSLDEIAAQAGLATAQFSKLFKERTNQSPVAYFIQLKMRRACELLHETNQPVASIAHQLGYDDPFHFSRLFKKVQGCAPANYRKSLDD